VFWERDRLSDNGASCLCNGTFESSLTLSWTLTDLLQCYQCRCEDEGLSVFDRTRQWNNACSRSNSSSNPVFSTCQNTNLGDNFHTAKTAKVCLGTNLE
jgi:hypothetical protein